MEYFLVLIKASGTCLLYTSEIERMDRQGVRLIGELVPYMMGWKEYALQEAAPIFELAQEKGMTVNVHPTTAQDLEQFAAMYPRLNILVAHPRDGEDRCV